MPVSVDGLPICRARQKYIVRRNQKDERMSLELTAWLGASDIELAGAGLGGALGFMKAMRNKLVSGLG